MAFKPFNFNMPDLTEQNTLIMPEYKLVRTQILFSLWTLNDAWSAYFSMLRMNNVYSDETELTLITSLLRLYFSIHSMKDEKVKIKLKDDTVTALDDFLDGKTKFSDKQLLNISIDLNNYVHALGITNVKQDVDYGKALL